MEGEFVSKSYMRKLYPFIITRHVQIPLPLYVSLFFVSTSDETFFISVITMRRSGVPLSPL